MTGPAFLLAALLATGPPPSAPGPVLAVEDTMHTEVPEVLVRAPRMTLDEILDRVAAGEERRAAQIQDQAFTLAVRVVRNADDPKKPPQLYMETVARIYKKRPDQARAVILREYRLEPRKSGGGSVNFRARAGMDEEIVNFAFRPSARRDYRYRIESRQVLGDHLVYRIAFEPRSALDPSEPRGLVWVDTRDYVIVRQELEFPASPVPILLQGIERMVVERRKDGDLWVLGRVLLRGRLTLPMPGIGRSFDVTLLFDDYATNAGVADSLFVPRKAR